MEVDDVHQVNVSGECSDKDPRPGAISGWAGRLNHSLGALRTSFHGADSVRANTLSLETWRANRTVRRATRPWFFSKPSHRHRECPSRSSGSENQGPSRGEGAADAGPRVCRRRWCGLWIKPHASRPAQG